MKYLNLFDCLPRKRNDLWFQLSTPAVYSQLPPCGHLAITDSSEIPGESYRRLTEINSRYYGLTDTLFSPNVTIFFFSLSL